MLAKIAWCRSSNLSILQRTLCVVSVSYWGKPLPFYFFRENSGKHFNFYFTQSDQSGAPVGARRDILLWQATVYDSQQSFGVPILRPFHPDFFLGFSVESSMISKPNCLSIWVIFEMPCICSVLRLSSFSTSLRWLPWLRLVVYPVICWIGGWYAVRWPYLRPRDTMLSSCCLAGCRRNYCGPCYLWSDMGIDCWPASCHSREHWSNPGVRSYNIQHVRVSPLIATLFPCLFELIIL